MDKCFTRFLGRPFIAGKFDCWSLIEEFYAQFGYRFDCAFRYKDSKVLPCEIGFKYFKDWNKVGVPKKGDLVLFKRKGVLYHGGVIVNRAAFMHATRSFGVVVSPLTCWKTQLFGFYRNAELDIC